MYCKNCGAELSDRYLVCVMCRKGKGVGDRYCAFCGAELSHPGAEKCDACGHLTGPEDPKKPITPDKMRFSPIFSAIISLIMPGMAQACNGQLVKGVLIFVCYVLLNGFTSGGIAGLVIQGIYAVVAAFEAARIAMKLRDGTAVGKFEFF
jgi:TM2 domain-containing membrane protein YozV